MLEPPLCKEELGVLAMSQLVDNVYNWICKKLKILF